MAERRPPGFNVDLGFYDSAEVLSIPRRTRAAAIGVWALAGAYSANKLQDGFVDAETLKTLGCTDAIRAALMSTLGAHGEPSPLWVEADRGGVQFTRWTKWQRTRAEVKAYRDAEAARKQRSRKAAKQAATSDDSEMSGRTTPGRSKVVRPDHRDPKTETETETGTYVPYESSPDVGVERGHSDTVTISASRLVATVIPDTFPAAVRTSLRLKSSELITRDGIDPDIVGDALRRWLTKSDAGPGLLPNLAADVIRERDGATNGRAPHKLRAIAELAQETRAQEQTQLENHQREALE